MGDFSEALAALADLAPAGVTVNYAAGDVPPEVDAARLPALLVLPAERGGTAVFGRRGDGFSMVSLGETGAVYTVEVLHLLLASPVGRGVGWATALPLLAGLVDAYFTALRSDARLGGALRYPPRVEVQLGVFEHGTGRYYGAAFRHGWVIGVA